MHFLAPSTSGAGILLTLPCSPAVGFYENPCILNINSAFSFKLAQVGFWHLQPRDF